MFIKIKNIETGEILDWPIEAVLEEINIDRSPQWIDYNESDWEEGWDEFVDGVFYTRHI
jgi:hypothetical protein